MSFSMNLNKGGNKKYGLILPQAKKQGAGGVKKKVPIGIFAQASQEENDKESKEEIKRSLLTVSANRQKVIEKTYEKALEQDASVFDYDGVYDSMQDAREDKVAASRTQKEVAAKESRYIGGLVQQSQIREREHDRIRERRLLKERADDDALYGDKDKFITSAYKKKLMENKRWEEEDARLAAIENAQDVTKNEHAMAGFYANLLTKNIAMGGDVAISAISKYTVGNSSEKEERVQDKSNDKIVSSDEPSSVEKDDLKDTLFSSKRPFSDTSNDVDVQSKAKVTEGAVSDVPPLSKEDKIMSAKERYLARKKAKQE